MTTLIFEPIIDGHHLEYLHHYYEGAVWCQQNKYVFLVTREFEVVKDKYVWKESNNIRFQYIDSKYDKKLSAKNKYILGWNTSQVLKCYVREIHPDEILLTTMMPLIPFICILIPMSAKIRGIMYKIYLYEQDKMSNTRLFAEKLRLWIVARSKNIESIFVLNDDDSAKTLNKIYRTEKFRFVPDPIPDVNITECKDLRSELMIPQNNKVFLHFGGLDGRKGTLEILRAIELSSKDELFGKTFIFAGKITTTIRNPFYALLEKVKQKVQILVYDEFCSYEFLYNLCFTCDIILMPYQITNLSSGVLGYAAVFGKTVIGPDNGLIGQLIRKFDLGYTIATNNPTKMKDSFNLQVDRKYSEYSSTNRKQNFIKAIIKYY